MRDSKTVRIIIFIIAATFTSIFFVVFFRLFSIESVSHEVFSLPKSWTVSINNDSIANVDIEEYLIKKKLEVGDEIIITNRMPELPQTHQTLLITSCLSVIHVFIDDNEIYTYGSDIYESGKMLGSGLHFVNLPYDSSGKELKIKYLITEENAFTSMGKIRYGNMNALYFDYLKYNLSAIAACIFLIAFGTILIVISVASLIFGYKFIRIIPVGVVSFLAGMYGICSIHFFEFSGANIRANTICEYVTLYMLPMSISCMFTSMMRNNTLLHKFLFILSCFWVVVLCVLIAMHFANIIRFPQMLEFFQILGAVTIILGLLAIAQYIKETGTSAIIVALGFAVLCFSGISDLCKFHIQKYLMPNSNFSNYCLLPIGALIFVVIIIINYVISVYKVEVEQSEKRILSKLAYTDDLCQIYNRTKYNEVIDSLDGARTKYSIVLFDLNGLKKTNDTKGHSQGDKLIKEFATILTECFEDIGEVFRIGGDEFVVIATGEKMSRIDFALGNIRRIEQAHSEIVNMRINSSYGVAYSTEVNANSVNEVYSLADRRMYEMKRLYHDEKKI